MALAPFHLTLAEVAARWECSEETLFEYAGRGKLALVYKDEADWRFLPQDAACQFAGGAATARVKKPTSTAAMISGVRLREPEITPLWGTSERYEEPPPPPSRPREVEIFRREKVYIDREEFDRFKAGNATRFKRKKPDCGPGSRPYDRARSL